MSLFHDEEEVNPEPIRGLPEVLPEGESLLWQGRPSATGLLFGAFRVRWIIGYFVLTTLARLAHLGSINTDTAAMNSVVVTSAVTCVLGVLLLSGIAYLMSRAAVFTITSKRVVIRHGIALPKYINAPFSSILSAQLKRRSARIGDIALQMDTPGRTPYLHLWPFAKPFHYSAPEPMLRSVPDPVSVAKLLADAVRENAPGQVVMSANAQTTQSEDTDVPAGAAPAH
ncbi:MAG: photosynthetic complex putative assembly protein PuhB [Pseudomonadota bacterium]